MDRFGLRDWDPYLKKAAVWTYWKGAVRDTGRDEGATLVIQTEGKKGWFWYIPLHDDIVSVGIVADHEYLLKNRESKDAEAIYFEEVAKAPGVQPRIANATPLRHLPHPEGIHVSRQAGRRRRLVPDRRRLRLPRPALLVRLAAGHDLGVHGRGRDRRRPPAPTTLPKPDCGSGRSPYLQGMDRIRRLVCEFYDGLSFGKFIRKHPHLKGLVTDVLIGDVFKDEVDVLWPLMDELRAETGLPQYQPFFA